MEVEIGRGKKARRAYGFDDVAIVPSRRTRDPDDVDISWTLGPYRFDLPLLGAALDGVVSPETAGIMGKLGGLAVLNLEGIQCRYEDPEDQLTRIASFSRDIATRELQDIYREPVKPELIAQRIREIKAHGVVAAASLTPAAGSQVLRGGTRRRPGHPRDPGHGRLGRACVTGSQPTAAESQGVHPRALAHPGGRRRLRLLPHRSSPDAHRCRRRTRRGRPGSDLHHPRRARYRCAAGNRDRRCRGRALTAHAGDR